MLDKPVDQITEQDLQALVDYAVLEGKTIEYKVTLPGSSDSEKKEFLADVSSFANCVGGDLIYGIAEDTEKRTPRSLDGIPASALSGQRERLDNILRDGIEPRIPTYSICQIPLADGSRAAFLIRVPKSWISPHRVRFAGNDKFYSRNSSGKYPLDVAELRIAFTMLQAVGDRIRSFRLERTSSILANETPILLHGKHITVLHLIPLSSFNPNQAYDISKVASQPSKMPPVYCRGWSGRYNLDGFVTYASGEPYSYVQLSRNGIIEAVEGLMLEPHERQRLIPSVLYEQEFIGALRSYLALLKDMNVDLPILVFMTLLGVKGYSMSVDSLVHNGYPNERDILQLPETVVEDYASKAETILKPFFDSIWNACGFERSLNYSDADEWRPHR